MRATSQDRWLRAKQFIRGGEHEKLPIALSTVWLWVAQGRLPAPTKLGPRVCAWRESDLDAAIQRIADGGVRR